MVKAHQKYKLSGFYNRDWSDSCLQDFDTTQSFGWIPMFWSILMPSSVLLTKSYFDTKVTRMRVLLRCIHNLPGKWSTRTILQICDSEKGSLLSCLQTFHSQILMAQTIFCHLPLHGVLCNQLTVNMPLQWNQILSLITSVSKLRSNSLTLMTEAQCSCETSAFNNITWCKNLDHNLGNQKLTYKQHDLRRDSVIWVQGTFIILAMRTPGTEIRSTIPLNNCPYMKHV